MEIITQLSGDGGSTWFDVKARVLRRLRRKQLNSCDVSAPEIVTISGSGYLPPESSFQLEGTLHIDAATVSYLAQALRKFAPDLADQLMERWRERDQVLDEFVAFLRRT